MRRGRLEAFSDGVLAIVITIMVLELKVPESHGAEAAAQAHDPALGDLWPLWPKAVSYVLSFLYLGIYWNNHHHLLHAVEKVDGRILWANLHLLFWLSLVPFATWWMGENSFHGATTALYGGVMLLAAVAYFVLQLQILRGHGLDSALARELGRDLKGKLSIVAYAAAIAAALLGQGYVALAIYALIALWWLVPDRRIARALGAD